MLRETSAGPAVSDELLYTTEDDIGWITFNRPAARNALTFAMYERLAEICAAQTATPSLRALILTGAGEKAFAAGTDIGQFRAFDGPQDAIAYEARLDRVLDTIERCPIPLIAALSGACTGGGAGIAACCDIRPRCASASRSRARWATACRWPTSRGSAR